MGTDPGSTVEPGVAGPVGAAEVAAELTGYLDDIDEVVRERLTDEVLDDRLAQIFRDSQSIDDPPGDEGHGDQKPGGQSAPGSDTGPAEAAGSDAHTSTGRPSSQAPDMSSGQTFLAPRAVKPSTSRMSSDSRRALIALLVEQQVDVLLVPDVDAQRVAQAILSTARRRAEQREDAALTIAARTVRQARRDAEQLLQDAQRDAARIVEAARAVAERISHRMHREDYSGLFLELRAMLRTSRTGSAADQHHCFDVLVAAHRLRRLLERPIEVPMTGPAGPGKSTYLAALARACRFVPSQDPLPHELWAVSWQTLRAGGAPPPEFPLVFFHPFMNAGGLLAQDLTTGLYSAEHAGPTGTVLSSFPGTALHPAPPMPLPVLNPAPPPTRVAKANEDPPAVMPGSFWASLDAAERAQFTAAALVVRFEHGAVLLQEGDVADHALVIRSGLVGVLRRRAGQGDRLIAVRGPGDLIGERAVLAMQGRSASVIATTNVTAWKISAEDLGDFLDRMPGVQMLLERLVFDRLVDELAQDGSSRPLPVPATDPVPAPTGAVEKAHELDTAAERRTVRLVDRSGAATTGDAETAPPGGRLTGGYAAATKSGTSVAPSRRVTILAVDVASFIGRSGGTPPSQLYEILRAACRATDLHWDDCYRQDYGDGALLIIPPSVPPQDIAETFATRLAAVLHRYNRTATPPSSRLRLRMAVHTGYLRADDHGPDDHRFSAGTLSRSALMARAPLFKNAMEEAGTDLGLILSDQAYGEAISQGGLSDPTCYIPVRITLPTLPPAPGQADAWQWWNLYPPPAIHGRATGSRSQAPPVTASHSGPSEPLGFQRAGHAAPVPSGDADLPAPDAPPDLQAPAGGTAAVARLGPAAPPATAPVTTRAWTWFPAGQELTSR
ncbi:cyclic nucleotide-binding domain-containing protein [Spirillospora sp. NBC_00431]